jgi:hypothetical protein
MTPYFAPHSPTSSTGSHRQELDGPVAGRTRELIRFAGRACAGDNVPPPAWLLSLAGRSGGCVCEIEPKRGGAMRFDIPWEDNYVGRWIGERSQVLTITKVAAQRYLVSLVVNGVPVKRPWMNDEPMIDMPAEYTFHVLDGADPHRIGRLVQPIFHFRRDHSRVSQVV